MRHQAHCGLGSSGVTMTRGATTLALCARLTKETMPDCRRECLCVCQHLRSASYSFGLSLPVVCASCSRRYSTGRDTGTVCTAAAPGCQRQHSTGGRCCRAMAGQRLYQHSAGNVPGLRNSAALWQQSLGVRTDSDAGQRHDALGTGSNAGPAPQPCYWRPSRNRPSGAMGNL